MITTFQCTCRQKNPRVRSGIMIKSSLKYQSQLTSDHTSVSTYLRLALFSSSTDQSRSNTGSATSPYSSLLVYSVSLISVPIFFRSLVSLFRQLYIYQGASGACNTYIGCKSHTYSASWPDSSTVQLLLRKILSPSAVEAWQSLGERPSAHWAYIFVV